MESTLDIAPSKALHGSSIIGLYFGCESCQHCGPVLEDLRQLAAQRANTSIILVPVGTTRAEAKRYFGNMYAWLSVPYDGAVGSLLVERFQIRTVPALVLLDELGKVICINGRARLAADKLGRDFPWRVAVPHQCPTVNFRSTGASTTSWPDTASNATLFRATGDASTTFYAASHNLT